MTVDSPSILCLEDEPGTCRSLFDELTNAGVSVKVVGDILEAEELVQESKFDLLIVDLRLRRGEKFLQDGGVRFVQSLDAGKLGLLNRTTPFVIHTAYTYSVNRQVVTDLAGYRIISPKGSPVVRDLASVLGDECPWIEDVLAEDDDPLYIIDDIVIFTEYDSDNIINVTIPAWEYGESVGINVDELPDEIRNALETRPRPIFAYAKMDASADHPELVRPHDFRLFDPEPKYLDEFDWRSAR